MTTAPDAPQTIYIGTFFGGIYRSDTFGLSWSQVSTPFDEFAVFSIALDPVDSTTLYAGTFGGGLFKTVNGGGSWQPLQNGLDASVIDAVAVNPFDGQVLLVATNSGLYRSGDAGASFDRIDLPAGSVIKAIAFDPVNQGEVYIGTAERGVFYSTDAGVNWVARSSGLGNATVIRLEFDSDPEPALYAATGDRAMRLEGGNDTWENITGDLPGGTIRQVLRDPMTGSLYAALDVGIYSGPGGPDAGTWTELVETPTRLLQISAGGVLVHAAALAGSLLVTPDAGENWYQAHDGLQNIFVGGLATANLGGFSIVYAGTDSGSFTTSDLFSPPASSWSDGQQWSESLFSSGGEPQQSSSVVLWPDDPRLEKRLFASNATAFGSGPVVWVKDQNLAEKVFTATVPPSTPGTVFVGTENAGVWRSENWGINWAQFSDGLVPSRIFSLAQSPVGDFPLYAGTSEGLFLSRDNGASWFKATQAAEPKNVFSIAPHPVFPGVAYFGASGGAIYGTLDNGGSVFRIGSAGLPPEENVRMLKIAPWSNFHAITSDGSYYSSGDQGSNWFRAMEGIGEPALSIEFNPDTPWILYMGTAGGGVYKSVDGGLSWNASNEGLDIPFVFSLAVNPADPSVLFAGTVGAVYKSIDGGESWSDAGSGLPNGQISALSVNPTDARVLYASVMGEGIYKSTDGGASWAPLEGGFPSGGTLPLAINPNETQTLYVGTEVEGLYRSTDGGASWAEASAGMSLFIRGLEVHPADENLLYATSLSNGIFRSTDAAQNWTSVGLRNEYLFDVALDPADTQKLVVASGLGVRQSVDGGESWALLGQRSASVFSVLADPLDPLRVYIGGFRGGLWRSDDTGQFWVEANSGLPAANVLSIVRHPVSSVMYAALDRSGVYRSLDDGETWQPTGMALIGSQLINFLSAGNAAGELYAASTGGGVFRTIDGGETWESFNSGLASLFVTSVAVNPFDDSTLYASVLDDSPGAPGVYRYSEIEGGWVPQADGIDSGFVNTLAFDLAREGTLYAGAETGVFRSSDGGQTWAPAASGLEGTSVTALFVDRDDSLRLYAGTRSMGVFASADAGDSWVPANSGVEDVSVSAIAQGATGGDVYVGTLNRGFLYSADGGANWPDNFSAEFITNPVVLAVAIDPRDGDVMYAATGGVGVMKSTDGGANWRAVNNGLDALFLLDIAIDPVEPDTLYVGSSEQGVYVSDDGGESWSPLNDNLLNKTVTRIAVDAVDHTYVYAGTEGGGLFRLKRR